VTATIAIVLPLAGVMFLLPAFVKSGKMGQWYGHYMKKGDVDAAAVESHLNLVCDDCTYSFGKTAPYRIVVMGGSSTAGHPYTHCDPSTYPSQLQKMFEVDTGSADCVEVMNLGEVAESIKFNIGTEFEELVVPHLHPDVVVVNTVNNDYYAEKKLFSFHHFLYLKWRGLPVIEKEVNTEPYRRRLRRMIEVAKNNDIALLFVEEPICRDYFYGANPIGAHQQALREVCEKNKVPLVPAQETFDRLRDRFLFLDFVHLTYYGNKRMATMIYETISGLRWIQPSECGGDVRQAKLARSSRR